MVFIISISVGIYLGIKIEKARHLLRETRNVKYIQAVVNEILSDRKIEFFKEREKDEREIEIAHKRMSKTLRRL